MTQRFFCLLLTLLPLAAFAHTGHGEHGFADGFRHPFLGIDHLLAMLLVGVWSVLNARKVWLAPAVFVVLLTIGAAAFLLRTVPGKWLSGIAATYVEVFRNIPLLVQLFIWYFVLPEVLPFGLGDAFKQQLDPLTQQFVSAMLCLAFFTSARVCEQVRSGINALPRGQKNAGLALGFTLPQTYRHVLLPMAFRLVVPPLTSEFLNIFKNSAVALAIGLTELTFQMRQMTGEYAPANPIEVMTYTSLLYLIVAFSVNRIMALVEKKVQVPGYIGGGK